MRRAAITDGAGFVDRQLGTRPSSIAKSALKPIRTCGSEERGMSLNPRMLRPSKE